MVAIMGKLPRLEHDRRATPTTQTATRWRERRLGHLVVRLQPFGELTSATNGADQAAAYADNADVELTGITYRLHRPPSSPGCSLRLQRIYQDLF